jgi:hypothetical protein
MSLTSTSLVPKYNAKSDNVISVICGVKLYAENLQHEARTHFQKLYFEEVKNSILMKREGYDDPSPNLPPVFEMEINPVDLLNSDVELNEEQLKQTQISGVPAQKRFVQLRLISMFNEKIGTDVLGKLGIDLSDGAVTPSVIWKRFQTQQNCTTINTHVVSVARALGIGRIILDKKPRSLTEVCDHIQSKANKLKSSYVTIQKELDANFSMENTSIDRLIILSMYTALPPQERSKLNMTKEAWQNIEAFLKHVQTKVDMKNVSDIETKKAVNGKRLREQEEETVHANHLSSKRTKLGCFYCGKDHRLFTKNEKGAKIWTCSIKKEHLAAGIDVKNMKEAKAASVNHVVVQAPCCQDLPLEPPGVNTTIPEITQGVNSIMITKDTIPMVRNHSQMTNSLTKYVIDSGSGLNTASVEDLENASYNDKMTLVFPNKSTTKSSSSGSVKINTLDEEGSFVSFSVKNAYAGKSIKTEILSEYRLIKSGIMVTNHESGDYKTLHIEGKKVRAYAERGVYYLRTTSDGTEREVNAINIPDKMDVDQYVQLAKHLHMAFGHISHQTILHMLSRKTVTGLPDVERIKLKDVVLDCNICKETKMRRMSYRNMDGSRGDHPLHTVHTDGQEYETEGVFNGKRGFKRTLNFVDDHTSFQWVYYHKTKSEVAGLIKQWHTMVEKQFAPHKVKILSTDGGTEYFNTTVENHCKDQGIVHRSSNAYTQQENGSAERCNQTSAAYSRALLRTVGFDDCMWPEAHRYGMDVNNLIPKRRLGWISSYESLTGKVPNVKDVNIFGAVCHAFIPEEKRKCKKLKNRSVKCRMVGFSEQYKGYKLWNLEDNTIIQDAGRDVHFSTTHVNELIKSTFDSNPEQTTNDVVAQHNPKGGPPKGTSTLEQKKVSLESDEKNIAGLSGSKKVRFEANQEQDSVSVADNTLEGNLVIVESTNETRRSARSQTKTKRYCNYQKHIDEVIDDKDQKRGPTPVPKSIREAGQSKERSLWMAAIALEHAALMENKVWSLVPLPYGKKAIRSQWLFSIKTKSDGSIERYKSRLVILGNMQKFGINYEEVFSPVCRLESLRIFLAICTILNLEIHQLDISTAFLHANLPDEVYMTQPEGTVVKGKENMVCRLHKALYGLRQSPRLFYELLHNYLVEIGFTRTRSDYCIYFRKGGDNKVTFLAVYVDDLSVGCNCMDTMAKIKEELKKRFKITDGGDLNFMLKMKVSRDRKNKKTFLSQAQYIKDMLKTFGAEGIRESSTPQVVGLVLEPGPVLTKEQEKISNIPYRNLIGTLMHLQRCTRPDISNAVRELSRFLNCYTKEHFSAALRILSYLKQTMNYGLVFDGENTEEVIVQVYSDASFGNKELGRRSVTGFALMLAGVPVSYTSVCQKSVSISTLQAEIVACSEACRESQWIRNLLGELGFKFEQPVKVFCDNTAAVQTIKNPTNHAGTKHIDIRYLYARELAEKKLISIEYVPTDENISDLFTKALPVKKFEYFREKLGIREISETVM